MGIDKAETMVALNDIFNKTIKIEKDLIKVSEEIVELENAINWTDQIEEEKEEETDD